MPRFTKITHLLKSDTLKDSTISFGGHMGSALINLLFFAVITRRLGPTQFGLFALAMTTAYLLKDIVDLALDSAVLRFLPSKLPHTKRQFLKQILTLRLYYLVPLVILGSLSARFFSQLIFHQPLPLLIVLSLIWVFSQSLLTFISTTFQARKQFTHAAFLISFVSLIRLSLLIILIIINHVSVAALIIISYTADIITIIVSLTHFSLKFLRSKPKPGIRRQVLRFSLPMLATSSSGILSDKLNVYITNAYTSVTQVGLLTSASRLFTPVQSLTGSLSRVFGSRFASFHHQPQATRYLLKSLSLTAILASGLLFSSLLAQPLILIFYGAEFLAAAPIFKVFTLGFALLLLQVPLTSYILYYLGRSQLMAAISIIQLLTTITFNLLLIPSYGILGAAWAFVLVIFVSFIVSAAATQIHNPQPN